MNNLWRMIFRADKLGGPGREFFLARHGQLHTFAAVSVFTFERGEELKNAVLSLIYILWLCPFIYTLGVKFLNSQTCIITKYKQCTLHIISLNQWIYKYRLHELQYGRALIHAQCTRETNRTQGVTSQAKIMYRLVLYRSDLVKSRRMLYRPDVCNCTMPYVPRTVPAYALRDPA